MNCKLSCNKPYCTGSFYPKKIKNTSMLWRNFILLISVLLTNTLSAQITNRCLEFDGQSNTYVSAGDVNALDGVSAFTVEAWIYIDQWNEGAYIYKKEGANWTYKISMSLGPVASKRLYFHVSDGINTYMAIDNSAISVGNWHHVAVAYNGGGSAYNQMKVYIDGTEVTNKWFSNYEGVLPSLTPSTTGDLVIGRDFNGKIDELRVWSRTLSGLEIEYRNTINTYHPYYSDLVVYYTGDQYQSTNVVDYKGTHHGSVSGNVTKGVVSGNDNFNYKIVSAYIREGFYQIGEIKDEYLLNNNDLILFGAAPDSEGQIRVSYPDNDGVLTNVDYLSSYSGRNGVLKFNGAGSSANCNKGLLNATGEFTFEAWVYIDEWVENSTIFLKQGNDWTNKVDIQLGEVASKRLYFHVNNNGNTYAAVDNSITVGSWNHIAFSYKGSNPAFGQIAITINGSAVTPWYNTSGATIPATCPSGNDNFYLGNGFKGKLDEIRMWGVYRTPGQIASYMNGEINKTWWDYSLMSAYWKVNDSVAPAKDLKNIRTDINTIKQIFNGREGAKFRIGLATGDYKKMMKTETGRRNFAHHVKDFLNEYNLDGVDLDFEWNYTSQEWADYNTLIETVNDSLPASSIFSVSLHSYFYSLTPSAMNAVDFIGMQIYGPQTELFPYDRFVADYNKFINYGYPAKKLVMGLPFYAMNNGTEITYKSILDVYPNLETEKDTVQINNYPAIFNGVDTVKKKAAYVAAQNMGGIMYWDSRTDTDYTNSKCLLRALNTEINANVPTLISTVTSKFANGTKASSEEQDLIIKDQLRLYPNPASNMVTVRAKDPIESITVLNQLGARVYFRKDHIGNENFVEINTSGYKSGLYFVKVKLRGDEKSQTLKLLVR
ncbi:LamG-like jellyroll fold domain-containing protein [Snuella sedimenti]|uniref:chitinase n=1 Tax=Snuella sedimenti TaxID=2798802 RepID=A0A8J7IV82_9FLAO|nr:LamG-like jellyroll fold domain-containing protein [Snuella sedimenti]MBJ6367465.1 T9SS type A sorting domain-containing protein [Snuella sedimenti]